MIAARRSVLKGLLTLPLTPGIVLAGSQEQRESPGRSLTLSTSRVLAQVLNRERAGARQPGDLARAETALWIMFEYMEATGVNDQLDREIRSHRAQLAAMTITDAMVAQAAEAAEPTMTKEEVRLALTKSAAQLHKFLDEFETVGGVRGHAAKLVTFVHARAMETEKQIGYRHIACCGPSCAATEAEGGLLAAGFGVATLFGCVPCGAIGAGLLFGTAFIQWLCV